MARRLEPGRLVLATHNDGKLREIRGLIGPFGFDVVSAGELGLDEPEETGTTFKDNARTKAMAAMEATGLPALADDAYPSAKPVTLVVAYAAGGGTDTILSSVSIAALAAEFEGAVIASNLIDGGTVGISVANFNEGGRLAAVSGNIIRNLTTQGPYPAEYAGFGIGIACFVRDLRIVVGRIVRKPRQRFQRIAIVGRLADSRRRIPDSRITHFRLAMAERIRIQVGIDPGLDVGQQGVDE